MKHLHFNVLVITLMLFSFATKITADTTGINHLKSEVIADLDGVNDDYFSYCEWILVGVVCEGKVVFTKIYLEDDIDKVADWGSVSKPATTNAFMGCE